MRWRKCRSAAGRATVRSVFLCRTGRRKVTGPAQEALMTTGTFDGFPAAGFTFFEQLAKNNNREWFQQHKETYERECRETIERLIAAFGVDPRKAWIPRIHRDIRFSRDKSPYKTHIAAG